MSTAPKSVTIRNIAWDTAAQLYFPPDFSDAKRYPAVVAGHPIGSCKEQTAGNVYAVKLAEAGFVAVAFDASFQGASGGEPRFVENPELRVSDFRYVVDYLQTLAYVDPERIGVLGVCGGGGYAISAATTDYRFKAVVGVAAANFGRLSREVFGGFDPVKNLEGIAAARTAEAQGAERTINAAVPPTVDDAKKLGNDPDLLEATEYYRTERGKHERGCVSFLYSHNAAVTAWDAFSHCETLLVRPLLVVVGDKPGMFGSYRDSHDVYGRAASKDKEILVVPNASHYDLYDKPHAVDPALAKIVPFLKKHLGEVEGASSLLSPPPHAVAPADPRRPRSRQVSTTQSPARPNELLPLSLSVVLPSSHVMETVQCKATLLEESAEQLQHLAGSVVLPIHALEHLPSRTARSSVPSSWLHRARAAGPESVV